MNAETLRAANIVGEVIDELNRARSLYPQWPHDLIHAAAIANEESGEVVKACNDLVHHGKANVAQVRGEAIQAAAMWIRFLMDTQVMR